MSSDVEYRYLMEQHNHTKNSLEVKFLERIAINKHLLNLEIVSFREQLKKLSHSETRLLNYMYEIASLHLKEESEFPNQMFKNIVQILNEHAKTQQNMKMKKILSTFKNTSNMEKSNNTKKENRI